MLAWPGPKRITDVCMYIPARRYSPRWRHGSRTGERDFVVRLGSRGRLTVPKPVRDALGWEPGDEIVFRVDGRRVVLTKKTARPGEDLEDTLAALADVRSRLCGSMDAVAVVREGRRELEGRSWPGG